MGDAVVCRDKVNYKDEFNQNKVEIKKMSNLHQFR